MPTKLAEAKTRTPGREILRDARAADLRRDLSLTIRAEAIDEKEMTVDLAYASEEPVERWFGNEILECTKDAVDLSRMNDGAALLLNHDPDKQLGVVVKAWVGDDRMCRAKVRFADDDEGKKYFRRVQTGIMRKVSVGYRINELVLDEQKDGELDTYRAKRWTGHEVSLVSIPADNSVGVGRSQTSAAEEMPQNRTMDKETKTEEKKAEVEIKERAQRVPEVPESLRMREIVAIGTHFKVPQDRIQKAVSENEALDSFRDYVMREHMKAEPVSVPPVLGMSRKERRTYSLRRAINRIASGKPLDGLEAEANKAARTLYKRGEDEPGFTVPHDIANFFDREIVAAMLRINPSLAKSRYGQQLHRDLYATQYPSAGALVPEEFLGGSFIEILRNRMLLTQLGVGTLSGLVGNVAIPRQSGAATAYWLAETDSVTESDQKFAQVAATPRRLAAQTAFTKQLLAQEGVDAEALIRDDLMRILAIAKDLAGIAGTGGKQPLGILNGPTTDSQGASTSNALQTVTFGTSATWPNVLQFETNVMTQNADISTINWLANITVRNKWKQITKVSNSTFPIYLCDDENRCNGYDVNVTNQIATSGAYANRAIFGAFGQALFCDWAGLDVVVDPYTQAASNKIVLTVNMFADFIVRHWPSFCVSTDSAAQ